MKTNNKNNNNRTSSKKNNIKRIIIEAATAEAPLEYLSHQCALHTLQTGYFYMIKQRSEINCLIFLWSLVIFYLFFILSTIALALKRSFRLYSFLFQRYSDSGMSQYIEYISSFHANPISVGMWLNLYNLHRYPCAYCK